MLAEALAALASTGGTALVTAMVTDGWEGIRTRFARVLGRGHAAEIEATEARLDRSRAALKGLTGPDLERAQAEQEIVWRTRLSDLLEQDPSVEAELRDLIAETQSQVLKFSGGVDQHVAAFDQAQQAVQGQGVQNITFGDRHEPGPTRG
jgi:hypothetical protein